MKKQCSTCSKWSKDPKNITSGMCRSWLNPRDQHHGSQCPIYAAKSDPNAEQRQDN